MLETIRNWVRYSPELSQQIGVRAGQQRHAYNAAVDLTLKSPNLSKYEVQAQLTLLRRQFPGEWAGTLPTQRPGLYKGRHAVRQFNDASKSTLRETTKEIKLREKPSAKRQKAKTPKHPVKPGRDINPDRLYRSRKAPLTLVIEDAAAIIQLDRRTIKADGLIIPLASRIPRETDIRTVQIRERKSSIRRGRNRPLKDRSYRITFIVQVDDPEEKVPWDNPVGLDAGVVHNLTDSEGRHFDQPEQDLAPSLNRTDDLTNRQKRLKRGGRKWTKLQKQIRKEKKRVTNVKDNWEHHTAKRIAAEASFVAVEALNHKAMRGSAKGTPENPGRNVRAKAGLNRSLANARPGAMQHKLKRQCEKNGTWFTKAPPRGTSQTCPLCGYRHRENRKSQAGFRCRNCGLEANAIAALNVQTLGLKALTLMLLLWAHGPDEQARTTRRRVGIPPLNDSLTTLSGQPGPKLDPSEERKPGESSPGDRPKPFEPKLSI